MIPLAHHAFQQLIHAEALYRYSSFRKAAKSLNISQPAFSRSIANLENSLGVTLFNRKSGNVTPTVYGELLKKRCTNILAESIEIKREIGLMKKLEIGKFVAAFGPFPADISGYQAVEKLITDYPNLRLKIKTADWHEVEKLVIDRAVDLGYAEISYAKNNSILQTELIGEHQVIYYCKPNHPLAMKKQIVEEDLSAFPLSLTKLPERVSPYFPGRYFTDENKNYLLPSIETEDFNSCKRIVMASNAISIAAPIQIEHELKTKQLTVLPFIKPWMKLQYGLIFIKDRILSPSTEMFREYVLSLENEASAKNINLIETLNLPS